MAVEGGNCSAVGSWRGPSPGETTTELGRGEKKGMLSAVGDEANDIDGTVGDDEHGASMCFNGTRYTSR